MTHQLEELREQLREGSEYRHYIDRMTPDGRETVEAIPLDWAIEIFGMLIAQHDTELLNEVEEKLLSYRGAYIAAGGKRVDDMVHHSVIKEVIEQYRVSPTIQRTDPVSENGDSETGEQYQHKPKETE